MEGCIEQLLEGKTITTTQCLNVDYASTPRLETFADVQLSVKVLPALVTSCAVLPSSHCMHAAGARKLGRILAPVCQTRVADRCKPVPNR